MTRAAAPLALAVVLALVSGCYCSHVRTDPTDASVDAATALDGGVTDPACTTTCESARVLARIPLDLRDSREPAVLDAVVHRDELVVLVLLDTPILGGPPATAFSVVRVSRRTGDVAFETVDVEGDTTLVAAGALASRGDTLTLVAAQSAPALSDVRPEVVVARWDGAATSPTLSRHALTEPQPTCAGCFRRGAAVGVGEDRGLVLLGGDGVLFVGRVGLDGAGLELEMASVPGVLPQTALGARGDPSGTALLAVGGLRETHGALATPALAVVLSADAPLAAPVAIPGADRDAVPYPWIHDGTMEIVRFVRDDGVAGGRFHRYAIEGSTAVELGTFATAGDLPPLAMASTRSTFVWAESSLAEIGAADLRVLAAPPRTCAAVTPASVAHLPTPLVDRDPRALVATEADGRTYVAFIEKVPVDYENATLVVLDLGSCRDTT